MFYQIQYTEGNAVILSHHQANFYFVYRNGVFFKDGSCLECLLDLQVELENGMVGTLHRSSQYMAYLDISICTEQVEYRLMLQYMGISSQSSPVTIELKKIHAAVWVINYFLVSNHFPIDNKLHGSLSLFQWKVLR